MQPEAERIVTYIRNPTWISTGLGDISMSGDAGNYTYTEEEKKQFRDNPEKLRALRKEIEHDLNQFFYILFNGSTEQANAQAAITKVMMNRLGGDKNAQLHEKLIPKWKLGCRRLTPGDGYLEALQEPNVTMEMSPIQKITDKGIVSAASTEEFDIIVCATGFDVSFSPFWDLVGSNGIRLADQWRENPEAYFGICAPNIPNYFIFNGPNCPAGHGNLITAMNWMADYILRWCRKIAMEDIKYVPIGPFPLNTFN